MNPRLTMLALAGLLALGACAEETTEPANPSPPSLAPSNSSAAVGINVVLKSKPTSAQLAQLNALGQVKHTFPEINGLTMAAKADQLSAVRALSFVKGAAIDEEVSFPPPTDLVPVSDFTGGFSSWDQDAINVTIAPGPSARTVPQTGEGVYVGILDTGLLFTWPQYFPQERIATQYARSFVGGGEQDRGEIVSPPSDLWQHDVCSHGTHVTSTVLGYQFGSAFFQGTAPRATIIPVQLHVRGSSTAHVSCSWPASVSAAGLLYFAQLKQGPLAGHPLVVNNSWGDPPSEGDDPLVKAAIDYALAQGVLLVFSAGNAGEEGMGFPGSYAPVISAAASGWTQEWTSGNWWFATDVPEPTNPNDFYITDFSSRETAGQDLDVAAPGSWVVGPFQTQRGQASYFFVGGTSMAAPHVTGTVALMLQKNPALTQAQAESIIENSAVPLGAGCRDVILDPNSTTAEEICWGADATGAGLLDAAAAVAATP
jgi:subtilisin family serine protease